MLNKECEVLDGGSLRRRKHRVSAHEGVPLVRGRNARTNDATPALRLLPSCLEHDAHMQAQAITLSNGPSASDTRLMNRSVKDLAAPDPVR